MKPNEQSALQSRVKTYLNAEAYSINRLANWCKNAGVTEGVSNVQDFKLQLGTALKQPGLVTPELYEKWTDEELEDQDAVQHRLQEIWDACFG